MRLISDSSKIPNFSIFRFEDVLDNPEDTLRQIYQAAGLDIMKVERIRLQSKPVIDSGGTHSFSLSKKALKDMFWYRLDGMGAHFQADVNENQIRNLDSGAKKTIERYSAKALEYFGYT